MNELKKQSTYEHGLVFCFVFPGLADLLPPVVMGSVENQSHS